MNLKDNVLKLPDKISLNCDKLLNVYATGIEQPYYHPESPTWPDVSLHLFITVSLCLYLNYKNKN